jgi:crossover junction endodeoxyribonuclease RuvC
MAIDPSLTGTAIVLLGKEETLRREYKTKSGDWDSNISGRDARYMSIISKVKEKAERYRPKYLFIENYAHNAQGKGVIQLGEFGGVLRHNIHEFFTFFAEVPPTVIKKFATGKGNANKAAVISAIVSRYGVQVKTDNEADAYALAQLGAVVTGYEKAQTRFQTEVIPVVRELIS